MYSDNEKKIRRFLRDPNSRIWDDTFLRNLWNNEQRIFARQIPFLRKVDVLRHPPQFHFTYFNDWEWQYTESEEGRPFRAFLRHRQSGYVCSHFWEVQHLGIGTGAESDTGYRYTHPFEGYIVGTPADLVPNWLPDDFHQAEKVFFDEEPVDFMSWREMLSRDIAYRTYQGKPQWWTIKDEASKEFYLYPRPAAVWDDIDGVADLGMVLHTNFTDETSTKPGILIPGDSDDQGDNARGVWSDSKFIYLANYTGGLHTYKLDIEGNLIHLDSDDQGDFAYDVWGDGDFIYLANGSGGLHTYSVSTAGILTHIDSDDQGNDAYGVWGDGDFIYLANGGGGLHTYSVDGSGNLTHIDSDDQGDSANEVWGDGDFIYLANDTGGLHTYSVDSSGTLTHLDSDDQGDNAVSVWGDGDFIYLANGTGGLHTYSVDSSGSLTHIASDDQGDSAVNVWGDGDYIFLANYTGGIHTYKVNSFGSLEHIASNDQGGAARKIWGDGEYLYLANDTSGLYIYNLAETGTPIDATAAEATANFGSAIDYLRAADNILMVYKARMIDITASDDDPNIDRYLQKYIEYGVLARAYRANNDGNIKSLADYWEWRKSLGASIMGQFVIKRLADRDYRLTSQRRPIRNRRRGPRLPSTYPEV